MVMAPDSIDLKYLYATKYMATKSHAGNTIHFTVVSSNELL